MAWLSRLDACARSLPKPARWCYSATRWALLLLGVYLVAGLAVMELRARRVGLGTGALVAVVLGTIKGISSARHR